MKRRVDRVLDSIKDSESGLTAAQMGFVERVRYSPEGNLMTVYARAMRRTHGCCTLIALTQQSQLLAQLEDGFKREFPEHWVRVQNV